MCMSASKNCINIYSYGCICVHCGCCEERNPNAIDRTEKQIEYYKERLHENLHFEYDEREDIAKLQRKNVKKNIEFENARIAELEQELKVLKAGEQNERICR